MAPQPPGEDAWVAVARIIGPRGNRGEVQAVTLCDSPGRFGELKEVFLWRDAGVEASHHRVEIEDAWEHKGRAILKFRGVDSISEAERWRGCEVRIPRSARRVLPDGEYYQSDLVGCEVRDRRTGQVLGTVTGWQELGGPLLVRVESDDGHETLIPFARAIFIEVDPGGRRILVDLPEGLKDLNG